MRCSVGEYRQSSEIAELVYRAIKVNYDHGTEMESTVLLSSSINEKAEWIADITQVGALGGWSLSCDQQADINFNLCSVWRTRSRIRFFSHKGELASNISTDCINVVMLCYISIGEPVELSSKFIRYSTFRTGKEQLVSILRHPIIVRGSHDCHMT